MLSPVQMAALLEAIDAEEDAGTDPFACAAIRVAINDGTSRRCVSGQRGSLCLAVWRPLRDRIGSMGDSLLDRHRIEILALAARRGASNVRVFGSAARGESHPDSDVDLLVSFETGCSLLDAIGFKHDVEDLIHRPVDVVTERALSPYLRESVLADAVPL